MILAIAFTILFITPPICIFGEVEKDTLDSKLDKQLDKNNSTTNDEEYIINCQGGILLSPTICIPNGYRKGELPTIPLEINTALEVNNIREIDDKKMTVSLEFHPQLVWEERRLITNFSAEERKSGKVLSNINLNHLWKPDLLIQNLCEFKVHSILEDMSGLALGNGLAVGLTDTPVIWYEFSAKAVIYCNFDFLHYPMDEQECNFTIGTTYPAKRAITFIFHTSENSFGDGKQNTDQFSLVISNFGTQRNDTTFGFTIKMQRRLQHFIMECYLPCIAIVVVSHISFIVPLDAVPGRVVLLVTQFLTLTNICIHQQAASPSAGQFTALGIYLLICLLVVVGAMIEFAILMYMRRKSEHKVLTQMAQSERYLLNLKAWQQKISTWNEAMVSGASIGNSVMDDKTNPDKTDKNDNVQKEKWKFLCESNRIDYIALMIFAILFINFNVVYWVYYLVF